MLFTKQVWRRKRRRGIEEAEEAGEAEEAPQEAVAGEEEVAAAPHRLDVRPATPRNLYLRKTNSLLDSHDRLRSNGHSGRL